MGTREIEKEKEVNDVVLSGATCLAWPRKLAHNWLSINDWGTPEHPSWSRLCARCWVSKLRSRFDFAP